MSNNINTTQEAETWRLMLSQAGHLIKSGAIPSAIQNAEQALAIIQYGRELSLPPMTALQNISLIKGKPTLSANLIGARLKNAGYKFKVKKYTDKEVEIEFVDLDGDKQIFNYTMEEASKSGNKDKLGDMYGKYSKEMLYARCLTRGGRIIAPEVLHGVYASEEFEVEEEVKTTLQKRGKIEVKEQAKNENPTGVETKEKNEVEGNVSDVETVSPELEKKRKRFWALLGELNVDPEVGKKAIKEYYRCPHFNDITLEQLTFYVNGMETKLEGKKREEQVEEVLEVKVNKKPTLTETEEYRTFVEELKEIKTKGDLLIFKRDYRFETIRELPEFEAAIAEKRKQLGGTK